MNSFYVSVVIDTHFNTTESITESQQGEKKEGPIIAVCAVVPFGQLNF